MKEKEVVRLDVPTYRQQRGNTCVPCALKMMLDFANKVLLTERTRDMEELEIAEVVKTGIGGTHLYSVSLINSELGAAVPSLEFIPEYQAHTLDDIKGELSKGVPVAVWIITSDGTDSYMHAVVITGYDETSKTITFNDPTWGKPTTISQSEFMSAWEPPGARMVKVILGRQRMKKLEDYVPKEAR